MSNFLSQNAQNKIHFDNFSEKMKNSVSLSDEIKISRFKTESLIQTTEFIVFV